MPTVSNVAVAMLRGVNVGGHNKIPMADFRELLESLGQRQVQTYIQSGNAVFATKDTDMTKLSERVATAIDKRLGFRPAVVCRTAPAMRGAIEGNPFARRPGMDPAKLLVYFLAGKPAMEVLPFNGPEELHVRGQELYVYYPNGVGQSKLALTAIERHVETTATGRNWNTVLKLLEVADALVSDGGMTPAR